MPYKIKKRSCTQSDGDKGTYVLSYTSDKGKKYNNCHTSKKKAQGQIAAIEAESVNMQLKEAQQAKFGPYEIKWTGDQLMFYVNGKLQKAIDVDANSFGMSDFKKTVKKIAAMKKMEDELPFSIMAEGEDINEKLDFIDDEEAAKDYEDLEDKDIDNDGDEDSSDKYLHHKLGTTAKKTESVNEISVKAGLQDVMKGRTSAIEGIKMSKEMAEALMYWISTSPYGRKYGKQIMKGRIASMIGPANAMGFGDRQKGKLKGEWKAIVAKHGPKREAVIEQLEALKEAPKMKVYSWEKNYKEALKQFDISGNIMKMKSSGGHAKVKKQIEKTRKALVALYSQMKINSTEF